MVTSFTSTLRGKTPSDISPSLHGTVEALLQLCLYLPAILVDVNQVGECKNNNDYDGNEDNGNDSQAFALATSSAHAGRLWMGPVKCVCYK